MPFIPVEICPPYHRVSRCKRLNLCFFLRRGVNTHTYTHTHIHTHTHTHTHTQRLTISAKFFHFLRLYVADGIKQVCAKFTASIRRVYSARNLFNHVIYLLLSFQNTGTFANFRSAYLQLLGAFAKLLKATISVIMSVCVRPSVSLSARIEQLASHWMDFHEI